MQGFAPGHAQALALADGEVLDAIVLAQHRAVAEHDLPLLGRQMGIEEGSHRAVVIGQAEILALRFVGGAQTALFSLQPRFRFG